MSFAAPAFLWLLAAVPVVIALHFLRTRRTRVDVSALFLWSQAKDLARRRRRFDRSWLLALQIAAVTAAALALARPQLGFAPTPDRVLVVDASASMTARLPADDGNTAVTRLDDAVAQAQAFLTGGGRIALVRAGLDATVAHPLDANRDGLRADLSSLRAGDRVADLGRALALARSIAPSGDVHLFGDTAPAAADAAGVRFHPVASVSIPSNVGITAFDLGLDQAFVAVGSNAPRPQEIEVVLERDGDRVASSTLLVPVGRLATATFPIERDGVYAARIVPPQGDALALDDVAYAGRTPLQVALLAPSVPLERALGAVPGTAVRFGGLPASADVHVLFGTRALDPLSLPPGRYLAFAEARSDVDTRAIRDWDRNDPLLRFVDLEGVAVGVAPEWTAPPGEGWTTLASTGDLRSVLARWRGDGRDVVFAAFHPSQTDMIYRPAFPTFIANVLATFGKRDPLVLGAALPPSSTRLTFGADGAVEETDAGARASTPGIYRVDGQVRPASLVSATETQLASAPPVPEADGGSAETVLAPDVEIDAAARRRDLALALVGLALVALVVEWFLYNGGLGRGVDRWRRDAPSWPRWMVRIGRRLGLG